ncbi:MAG: hypothetical protein M4D80_19570 [Myxococcota bacterium]|nr:hypothetical protein [Deltaproteobacteria bacterium]MDQ3337367.1 hypothetical protein [Myxococcota bacterium]
MRIWIVVVACLVACKRDRAAQPTQPPPSVNIRRLSPVIGERIGYRVTGDIKVVLGDNTNKLEAIGTTDIEANEVITSVQNGVVRERTITFVKFQHQPLGAKQPLSDVVSGKTYRWTGTPDPAWSDDERRAIAAYVRRDTGEPDLATYTLTDRDFTRGVVWKIPPDEPAPFLRGTHEGAQVTLDAIDGAAAMFRVDQVVVLDVGDLKVPLALAGGVTMNIGTARIEMIALDGKVSTPTGTVREAQMTSRQTFTHTR